MGEESRPKASVEDIRQSVLMLLRRLQSLPPEEIYNSLQVMIDEIQSPHTEVKD